MSRKIAFQGELGAFSHATAVELFPDDRPVPCVTFEQTIAAVQSGEADYAVVPVENSLYGRITDIHHILPESGLYIIGEQILYLVEPISDVNRCQIHICIVVELDSDR